MIYDRMNGDLSANDRMIFDRMVYDRMVYDRMVYDRMGARNRTHSMRNPPDIFVPEDCVKDGLKAWQSQRTLRLRSS